MINISVEMLQIGLQQGLILALIALGVSIPFRWLNFPDLTVEGSYPFGGVITVILLMNGVTPFVALILGALSAGLLGLCTAFIYLRYNVNTLLAGIIVSTMVYTLNLRLMGRPNLDIFNYENLFLDHLASKIIITSVLVAGSCVFLISFFKTQVGLRLQAVGLNPIVAERQGVNLSYYSYLALFIGNALCGLAGGVFVNEHQYVDIGMGVGMIINALAAMMLGEVIIGVDSRTKKILAPIIGALVYQQVQGIATSFGLASTDLKAFTAILVLCVIAVNKQKAQAR